MRELCRACGARVVVGQGIQSEDILFDDAALPALGSVLFFQDQELFIVEASVNFFVACVVDEALTDFPSS